MYINRYYSRTRALNILLQVNISQTHSMLFKSFKLQAHNYRTKYISRTHINSHSSRLNVIYLHSM